MGTASHHHYNRFGKGIDWKSELQNNANAFNWFWVQGFLKIDYLHFLLLSKFGKSCFPGDALIVSKSLCFTNLGIIP